MLQSEDLEQILPLADLGVPGAYLRLLGSSDEPLLQETLRFFGAAQRVLVPTGEHCQAGLRNVIRSLWGGGSGRDFTFLCFWVSDQNRKQMRKSKTHKNIGNLEKLLNL